MENTRRDAQRDILCSVLRTMYGVGICRKRILLCTIHDTVLWSITRLESSSVRTDTTRKINHYYRVLLLFMKYDITWIDTIIFKTTVFLHDIFFSESVRHEAVDDGTWSFNKFLGNAYSNSFLGPIRVMRFSGDWILH